MCFEVKWDGKRIRGECIDRFLRGRVDLRFAGLV